MKKEYKTPTMKVVAVRTRRMILGTSDEQNDSVPITGERPSDGYGPWGKEENEEIGW